AGDALVGPPVSVAGLRQHLLRAVPALVGVLGADAFAHRVEQRAVHQALVGEAEDGPLRREVVQPVALGDHRRAAGIGLRELVVDPIALGLQAQLAILRIGGKIAASRRGSGAGIVDASVRSVLGAVVVGRPEHVAPGLAAGAVGRAARRAAGVARRLEVVVEAAAAGIGGLRIRIALGRVVTAGI